jgi:hypothetical protein
MKDVVEARDKYDIQLFVYRCNKDCIEKLSQRFYKGTGVWHSLNQGGNLTVTKIKKIASEIEYAKGFVMKMGNPAKIIFDEEQDLRVALGLEDPEVTASLTETTQAQKAPAPVQQPAKKALKQSSSAQKLRGSVFIFVPIGLPGMGKSVFWETTFHQQLQQAYPNAYIQRISFEELHHAHFEKLRQKQRGLGDDTRLHLEAFSPATDEFNQHIQKSVESAHKNASVALLYLDKSFSEKELQQLQKTFEGD